MHVQVTSAHLELMLREALRAHPHECCGILLGTLVDEGLLGESLESVGASITAIQPAANVHADPARHFEIDPQALVDAHRGARGAGPQVLGYYHSHPVGPAEPSATDRASASGDGRIWAIIARDTVRFWRDLPDDFVPLSYGE